MVDCKTVYNKENTNKDEYDKFYKVLEEEYSLGTTTTSRSYIENKKLPVFIMIGTGTSFHYLVAFGVGKIGSTNYIYVTDNGAYIGSYNYYPYWRKEGSNYGIRYKLTKKQEVNMKEIYIKKDDLNEIVEKYFKGDLNEIKKYT